MSYINSKQCVQIDSSKICKFFQLHFIVTVLIHKQSKYILLADFIQGY